MLLNPRLLPSLGLLLALFTLASCEKEGIERSGYYTVSVPIYALRADVQDSIERQAPRPLCAPGNIFARGQYLFINEPRVGWHVFDNSRPEAPVAVAFWQLPGSAQLSFANGRFLSDCYGDILTLEVDDDLALRVHGYSRNVLSYNYYDYNGAVTNQSSVITGYRDERVEYETFDARYYDCCFGDCDYAYDLDNGSFSIGDANTSIQASGSFSRFAVRNDYLYAVSDYSVQAYQIGDTLTASRTYGWGSQLETAFISGDYLYAGAASGLYIYSLADPAAPTSVGMYRHIQGCDPVAVQGDYAVVTVRDGRDCGSNDAINTLTVLDVHDPANPIELSVMRMKNPHGVALLGDRVYVCEGESGLRVFDFDSKNGRVGAEQTGSSAAATDIMILPYTAGLKVMTVSPEGFRQYDGEAAQNLAPVSLIPVSGC